MKETNLKTEDEPVFPEKSSAIIKELLEKYSLINSQEEETKKILEIIKDTTKKTEEKNKILDNLPGTKLAKLVADYGYNKISLEDVPIRIEKDLNIDPKKANKLAEELKAVILDFIGFVKLEELIERKDMLIEENPESEGKATSPISPPKKQKETVGKDSYREPIE